jgi:hypothetical protein
MSSSNVTIADWVQLIRSEYLEMPGLQLTEIEVQRLCGLDATTSAALLDAFVHAKFLRRTRDGFYLRRGTSGHSKRHARCDDARQALDRKAHQRGIDDADAEPCDRWQ